MSIEGVVMRALVYSLLLMTLLPTLALAAPDLSWSLSFDSGGSYSDKIDCSLVGADGDLFVGGSGYDGVEGKNLIISRVDQQSGERLWTTQYAATSGNDVEMFDLEWDSQGKLIVIATILACVG
jgi:hypothetical protein